MQAASGRRTLLVQDEVAACKKSRIDFVIFRCLTPFSMCQVNLLPVSSVHTPTVPVIQPAAPAMVPRKKVRRVDCCEFMAGILHYGFSVSASDSRAGE